ncbi:MAG: DUF4175 family protein, partial [Planctomycetota bacterium]
DWWFTIFDTTIRTALTAASLLLAVAVFLLTVFRPLMAAFVWTQAAHEADAEVPQLEERWTTISHFAKSDHQPTTPFAKAMLQQVTSEAVALGSLVEPARIVRVARLQKSLLLAGASVAVLIGVLAVNWQQNSVLLRRFWSPTAQITATQLESVTSDVAIPRGQSIDIVTKLTGLQRAAATLVLVTDADEPDSIVLPFDPKTPETFTHRVAVDESFRYLVRAGDGRTEWHSITAIDPPEISEVRLTVTAPDYVDIPPYEKSLLPGRVKVIQGSRLTLEMKSSAALERFELRLVSGDATGEAVEQTLTLTAQDDGWYRFETLLEVDLALSPALFSSYGLTNEDRRTCQIRVIPDKAPVARVISPTEEMTVSADEVLEIKFEAHDDHGIAKAELVVYEENTDGEREELAVQEIPLDEQQLEKHVLGTTKLDLSKFDLEVGKNISYAVRVTDNRMLNVNPEEVAAHKNKGDKSGDRDAKDTPSENTIAENTAGEKPDPASVANATEPRESSETTETPDPVATAGTHSDTESKPSGREASENSNAADASPEKTQLAKSDVQGQSKEEMESEKADGGLPKTEGETSETPAPAGAVAASVPAPVTKPDAPASDDQPQSPAVAATTAKPTEDAEEKTATPSGGSPNPQAPTNADPQLAQSGGASPRKPDDQDTPLPDPNDRPTTPEV